MQLESVWKPEIYVFDDEYCSREKTVDEIHDGVTEVLNLGADPNGRFECRPLSQAVGFVGGDKVVKLLLAYGADPRLDSSVGVPITWAVEPEIARLLVHAGADINAQNSVNICTLVGNLCLPSWPACPENLVLLLWALNHGGNPNIGPEPDCVDDTKAFPIHFALISRLPERVIALLQHKVDLGVRTGVLKKPLDLARDLYDLDWESHSDLQQQSKVQHELLRAFIQHKLDPNHVYEIYEYEAMGISHESAEIIQEATEEVNEFGAKWALDDFKYGYHDRSIPTFIRDRESGLVGRPKK